MYVTEAIRTAMGKFGNKAPMSGEQVRWGLENLTPHRGAPGRRDRPPGLHQPDQGVLRGPRGQRAGLDPAVGRHAQWNVVSDWISPMRDVVRPLIEQAAAAYAKENNIRRNNCAMMQLSCSR